VVEYSRERRAAELKELQAVNPRDLIEQYCRITGEAAGNQLPHGISFRRMIEAILEHETATERPVNAT
jgi:hypothetical protein